MAFQNPQTGFFSANNGQVTNQAFFDAAFANRIHADPIFKEAYSCNITQMCNMSTWLDEYMGYETSCDPKYSIIETNSVTNKVKVKTLVTVAVNPASTVVAIDNASHYVGGNYVLPQVGNTIVSKNGVLMEVTAMSVGVNASTMSLRIRDTLATAQTIQAGDELLVLSGSFMADCECPTGNFRFQDLPIVQNLQMITIGDKGDLCGDALNKCQYLKIPFTDENGKEYDKWYTQALQDMYKSFEARKHYERLLNPNFGVIPVLKARGLNFTTASATEITLADVRSWKLQLSDAGIGMTEFAIFCGADIFQQWQVLLSTLGGTAMQNVVNPTADCKWINMEYCGIRIAGLTLHIYEDCSFANGKELGGVNSGFRKAMIWVPLGNRSTNLRGGTDTGKMFTTVYFKDINGRVWDNLTDSNGILNGPNGRNTFGTGCEKHEWTIKSRFLQEVHCPNAWGWSNLP